MKPEYKSIVKWMSDKCKTAKNELDSLQKRNGFMSYYDVQYDIENAKSTLNAFVNVKIGLEKYFKKMAHEEKIKEHYGNLFDFIGKDNNKYDIIIHGCNAQGKMGSGFAKELKERYPGAYDAYMEVHANTGLFVGDVVYYIKNDGVIVANAITQKFYGYDGKKYASYDAIDQCFIRINDFLMKLDNPSSVRLHFPKIASDLGGCDWEVVKKIIEHRITEDVEMHLYIK